MIRASGSHGVYDLVAVRDNGTTDVRFIQCKVSKDDSSGMRKRLLRELLKASPVKHNKTFYEPGPCEYCGDISIGSVSVELALKIHGNSKYNLYPLWERN